MPVHRFWEWWDPAEKQRRDAEDFTRLAQERLRTAEAGQFERDAGNILQTIVSPVRQGAESASQQAQQFMEYASGRLQEANRGAINTLNAAGDAAADRVGRTTAAMGEELWKPNPLAESARGLGTSIATGLVGGEPTARETERAAGDVGVDALLNIGNAAAAGLEANLPTGLTKEGGGPQLLGMGVSDVATALVPGRAAQAAMSGGIGRASGPSEGVGKALDWIRSQSEGMKPGRATVVPPDVARRLPGEVRVPDDPDFLAAVESAGGKVTPEGIEINVIRSQDPNLPLETAGRGGVFYEPGRPGAPSSYANVAGEPLVGGVGGSQRIEGRTLVRNPLVVRGGEVVDNALESLGFAPNARQAMEKDINGVLSSGSGTAIPAAEDVLRKWGGDPSLAEKIVRGQDRSEWTYALRENIIANEARRSGYDSIFTIETQVNPPDFARPVIREAMDLREAVYPSPGGEFALRPEFGGTGPSAYQKLVRALIDETGDAEHAEYLASGIRRGDYLGNLNADHIRGTIGKGADELIEAVRREGRGPGVRTPSGAMGIVPGQPSDRYYHGTAGAFDRPDPGKFDPNGLFGPGYYLTSDPRVAGSYSTASAASTPKTFTRDEIRSNLEGLADQVERSGAKGAKQLAGWIREDAAEAERLNTGLIRQIDKYSDDPKYKQIIDQFDRSLTHQGANIRAVDVPRGLRLLDADQPISADEIKQIARNLDPESRFPNLVSRWEQSGALDHLTGQQVYDRLLDSYRDIYRADLVREAVAMDLRAAGYDGIRYKGGQRVPMLDDTGKPIEHDVTVIFPESLDKVRNAFSGTAGGILPKIGERLGEAGMRTARDAGMGAVSGGYAASQEEGADLGSVTQGALLGGLGGAARGKLGQALVRQQASDLPENAQALLGGALGSGTTTWEDWFKAIRYNSMLSSVSGIMTDVVGTGIEIPWRLAGEAVTNPAKAGREASAAVQAVPQAWGHFLTTLGAAVRGQPSPAAAIGATGSAAPSLSQQTTGLSKALAVALESPGALRGAVDAFYTHIAEQIGLAKGLSAAEAQQFAERLTFKNEMGKAGRGVEKFAKSQGVLGHLMLPFIKTPYNILGRAIDRSPIGAIATAKDVALSKYRPGQPLKPGEMPLEQRVQDAALGSLMWGGMVYLAMSDAVTGAGPDSDRERAMLRAQGWQPYSVKIGDKYVSYANWGPFGMMLSAATAPVEAYKYRKDEDAAWQVGVDALNRFGRIATDQTYLRSLGALYEAIKDPGSRADDFLFDTIASTIPFGGALGGIARAVDPVVRKPDEGNLGQVLQAKIPGLRQNVPAMTNVKGEPIQNEAGLAGLVLPVRFQSEKPDAVLKEMTRLDVPMPEVGDRIGETKLTPRQAREYRELAQGLRGRLAEQVMAAPAYKAADDAGKAKLMQQAMRRAQGWAAARTLPGQTEQGRELFAPQFGGDPDKAMAAYVRALDARAEVEKLRDQRFLGVKGDEADEVARDRSLLLALQRALGEAPGRAAFSARYGTKRLARLRMVRPNPRYARELERIRRQNPEYTLLFEGGGSALAEVPEAV